MMTNDSMARASSVAGETTRQCIARNDRGSTGKGSIRGRIAVSYRCASGM
jgi:hypothetical protein